MTHFRVPILAAGAVVWRPAGATKEVVLVHRPRGDWSFPKGKAAFGEPLAAAAVREVREETGLSVVLGSWLAGTRYDKDGWPKVVDYFAAVTAPATADLSTPSTEIDEMCWRPLDRAAALLMGAWGTTAAHDRRSWALTLGIAVVGSHDRSYVSVRLRHREDRVTRMRCVCLRCRCHSGGRGAGSGGCSVRVLVAG